MRRALTALLVAAAAAGIDGPEAWAEPPAAAPPSTPDRVVLLRSGCAPLPFREDALASRLRVELAEGGVRSVAIRAAGEETGASRAREVSVTIVGACSGGELTIFLDAWRGSSTKASIDVREMSLAIRERALALAIAELFRERAAELARASATAAHAQDPEAPASRRARPCEPRPEPPLDVLPVDAHPPREPRAGGDRSSARPGAPVLLSAGVEWRFLFQHNTAMTGGRLAASLPVGADWIVRFNGEGGAFYDSDENGARFADLWLVTGGFGISGGYRGESTEFGIGPRMELGFGRSRQTSLEPVAEEHGESAAIAIASVIVAGRVRLMPRLWLSLDLEIGQVLVGLGGSPLTRPPPSLGGTLAGTRLSLALAL